MYNFYNILLKGAGGLWVNIIIILLIIILIISDFIKLFNETFLRCPQWTGPPIISCLQLPCDSIHDKYKMGKLLDGFFFYKLLQCILCNATLLQMWKGNISTCIAD